MSVDNDNDSNDSALGAPSIDVPAPHRAETNTPFSTTSVILPEQRPAGRRAPMSDTVERPVHTRDGLALVDQPDETSPMVVRQQTTLARALIRARDIVVSLSLLLIGAPVMLLLWLLIRVDSRGRAIFSHERVGIGGRTFRFYKFRTMWVDARERFPDLYAYQYTPAQIADLQFKKVVDPRLTRVGRWLRRTSLDELPNLFNVLRGDMTLVGPRPDIPQMQCYYRPDQQAKFAVKPGLTGLAQVRGRNILSFQETIHYDLLYVAGKSFWLDTKILTRTVWVVCRQWGAL